MFGVGKGYSYIVAVIVVVVVLLLLLFLPLVVVVVVAVVVVAVVVGNTMILGGEIGVVNDVVAATMKIDFLCPPSPSIFKLL